MHQRLTDLAGGSFCTGAEGTDLFCDNGKSLTGFSGAGAKKPDAAAQSYSVGETVKHKAYGTGVILSMQKMANDTMLEIAFEKVGTKKIMANYAKLEKV